MNYILLLLFIININITLINTQWSNLYIYPNQNCDNEIPGLISTKLNTCVGIVKYSCNSNTTTEFIFYDDECKNEAKTISFDNFECNNGQTVNCSIDAPLIPSKSFVLNIYDFGTTNCNNDSQIIQYNTVPLNTCYGGTIYTCSSNTLNVIKYEDRKCLNKIIHKFTQKLGCIDGYTNYLCT